LTSFHVVAVLFYLFNQQQASSSVPSILKHITSQLVFLSPQPNGLLQ